MSNDMLNLEELENLEIGKKYTHCRLCSNNCNLTVHSFGKKKYITGNRCEKPIKNQDKKEMMNLYQFSKLRKFELENERQVTRETIVMPRVLNMYENYPLFFHVFTYLGFDVVLSGETTKNTFELGMDTIPSDTLCYPAKLVNGHIQDIIDQGYSNIFYPSVIYEKNDERKYSCPVVTSYPEVISKNMDSIKDNCINFMHPFLIMDGEMNFLTSLSNFFKEQYDIPKKDVVDAVTYAKEQVQIIEDDIFDYGLRIMDKVENENEYAICLAGRPYHMDNEINHKIDSMISEYGFHIVTEDFLAKLETDSIKLRVVDQWEFHSRLYKAASYVGKHSNLELIQLNSFGCGLDAITTDQVKEILEHHNKIYTCLKIDEGDNLGAARIRIRSLKAAIDERRAQGVTFNKEPYNYEFANLTKPLKDYQIFMPQMSPIHFRFIETAMNNMGYNLTLLPDIDDGAIDTGLKYVNNDSCYPALVVIGQMVEAVQHLEDTSNVALIITQTGGGCRASNYIALLRRALENCGLAHIPVISLSFGNISDENAFSAGNMEMIKILKRALIGSFYGDVLNRVTFSTRPYEKNKGETNNLMKRWSEVVDERMKKGSYTQFKKDIIQITKDFDAIEVTGDKKPKVGIVGEILVKYHPTANNNLIETIEKNGGEAVLPDFVDFFLYSFLSGSYHKKNFENKKAFVSDSLISFVENIKSTINKTLQTSDRFAPVHSIYDTAKNAEELVGLGNKTGEGWYLTGEMVTFIKDDVPNIVCTQPFGCLPNHITGKGMFKKLTETYPMANICPIDYDPGASEVNQISRIKLMMSVAKRNLNNPLNVEKKTKIENDEQLIGEDVFAN